MDMDVVARMTSKGQVTVPKVVRDALGVSEGDSIIFHVEGDRAVLARTQDFLELSGSLTSPAAKRNVAWDHIVKSTRAKRAMKYR
jgi:AbrB family looped-hinge helix DNA binding protein